MLSLLLKRIVSHHAPTAAVCVWPTWGGILFIGLMGTFDRFLYERRQVAAEFLWRVFLFVSASAALEYAGPAVLSQVPLSALELTAVIGVSVSILADLSRCTLFRNMNRDRERMFLICACVVAVSAPMLFIQQAVVLKETVVDDLHHHLPHPHPHPVKPAPLPKLDVLVSPISLDIPDWVFTYACIALLSVSLLFVGYTLCCMPSSTCCYLSCVKIPKRVVAAVVGSCIASGVLYLQTLMVSLSVIVCVILFALIGVVVLTDQPSKKKKKKKKEKTDTAPPPTFTSSLTFRSLSRGQRGAVFRDNPVVTCLLVLFTLLCVGSLVPGWATGTS